jgi:hypothetical protein
VLHLRDGQAPRVGDAPKACESLTVIGCWEEELKRPSTAGKPGRWTRRPVRALSWATAQQRSINAHPAHASLSRRADDAMTEHKQLGGGAGGRKAAVRTKIDVRVPESARADSGTAIKLSVAP